MTRKKGESARASGGRREILQQPLHNLPWATLCTIMDKAAEHRNWYARAVVEYGWSRSILVMQIEADAHHRFGKATTNFERTLPSLAFWDGAGIRSARLTRSPEIRSAVLSESSGLRALEAAIAKDLSELGGML